MIKYRVIRVSDNKLLSEWYSDFAGADYYEENWGKGQYERLVSPEVQEVLYQAAQPAVLDEQGNEISPAVPEVLAVPYQAAVYETVPAEYTYEVVDATAEIDQQRINAEARAYLASTDWVIIKSLETGIQVPMEITLARAAARARVI